MTDHPVGSSIGTGKTLLWYGPEVEGKKSRTRDMTAFVDGALSFDLLEELLTAVALSKVVHVFLTERFADWAWFEACLLPHLQRRSHVALTVARNAEDVEAALSLSYAGRFHIMARANMSAAWMSKLRPSDQVSVGEPYSLTTWVVRDGFVTVPDDYKDDKR